MATTLPDDLQVIVDQLDAAERDATLLAAETNELYGRWHPDERSWSIAQCLDHLATSNRVYLAALRTAADRARTAGRLRRGAAVPGTLGRWFVASLEPPVKTLLKAKARQIIQPRHAPSLAEAFNGFLDTQRDLRGFVRENADLDLARVTFRNPIAPVLRFSLASGLHILLAHERRHLWQARRVRHAAGAALGT